MKKLFVLINVIAGFLAFLAAFKMLQVPGFTVDQIGKGIIALAIGFTCIWIASQAVTAPNQPLL